MLEVKLFKLGIHKFFPLLHITSIFIDFLLLLISHPQSFFILFLNCMSLFFLKSYTILILKNTFVNLYIVYTYLYIYS